MGILVNSCFSNVTSFYVSGSKTTSFLHEVSANCLDYFYLTDNYIHKPSASFWFSCQYPTWNATKVSWEPYGILYVIELFTQKLVVCNTRSSWDRVRWINFSHLPESYPDPFLETSVPQPAKMRIKYLVILGLENFGWWRGIPVQGFGNDIPSVSQSFSWVTNTELYLPAVKNPLHDVTSISRDSFAVCSDP